MEAVNGGSLGEDKGGPPPPSPLTGCYLLVVIGEPHSGEHKDIVLQRVAKGLLSWDVNNCLVDLEKELSIITDQGLEGEEARHGERLIQFASENLVTEILIHPAVSTLSQCVRNLLSSFTRHRHIIHAGYTFQGNGSWALQDGTFSYSDFSEAFQEIEVQRVIHAYENSISIDLHCSPEGEWARLPKESFTKACKVRVNPTDVLTTGSPSISNFIKYLAPFLVPTALESILESSDVVGNIRFSRPTLYVFPGGQGDAALFGINGFNMLLDGGYSRKACFWDFVRHLDRLDAVLLTRLNNSSVCGISSVLKRKRQGAVYPQVGHFFCNIQERKSLLSPDGDKDRDPLIFSILEEGQSIVQDLQYLHLTPQSCYRDSEPIILYHKVGHGTLNMYVLSPDRNSREVREFLQKWNQSEAKMFSGTRGGRDFSFPLQNLVSICALLVWQPANPNDTITRILYPGSTPQKKIFDGLDRLKSLECIKHSICSEKSLAPVKKTKQDVIEKLTSKDKAISEKRTENKLIEDALKNGEMNGDIIKEKQVKKSDSLESDKEKKTKKVEDVRKVDGKEKTEKIEDVEKIVENGEKVKVKAKSGDAQPIKKRGDSQHRKKPATEKKGPPTPKKTLENKTNGDVKEKEIEKKAHSKPSPTATPAKSTKDANNRRVIESKKTPPKKEAAPKHVPLAEAKPKPERKPISRRPKTAKGPPSPMKKMTNGLQKPDSISKRGKLDKEGTTDSSTVSTPSADQESILKKDISKLTPKEIQQLKEKELDELKEEQEAVKEIEAVFRKGEEHVEEAEPGVRKIKDMSIDDNLEAEEYLIIEKEEIEHDSLDQETKEDEMQKLARDSEESEKQRKLSSEEKEIEIQAEQTKDLPKEETLAKEEVSAKIDTESKKREVSSPEDKAAPTTDKKELADEEIKEIVESHPEEKVSANVESGATTTAPTLPEDERITLDEIKEDNGQPIEEKHVKEETKEKEVPIIRLPPQSQQDSQSKLPPNVGISLDKQKHIRDIVKTPDEVADLPVHEEADYHEFHGDAKKSNEADLGKELAKGEKKVEVKKDDKEVVDETKDQKPDVEKKEEVSEKEKSEEEKVQKNGMEKEEILQKQEPEKVKIEEIVTDEKKDETEQVEEVKESDRIEEQAPKKDITEELFITKDIGKDIKTESQIFLDQEKSATDYSIASAIVEKPKVPEECIPKTDDTQKFEILEKAELETKEKVEKESDKVLLEKKLKEDIDDEWVVITKEDEEDHDIVETAQEAGKTTDEKNDDLNEAPKEGTSEYEVVKAKDIKEDLKDEFMAEVKSNNEKLENLQKEEEPDRSKKNEQNIFAEERMTVKEEVKNELIEPPQSPTDKEPTKETKIESESEYDDHEIRKEDEIEEILEKEKVDIKALIEEADKKNLNDKKVDDVIEKPEILEEKINHIKETKEEVKEIDDKIQELKKEVKESVEELNLARNKRDLTKIEEPIHIDLKQDVKELAKIDDKLQELKQSVDELPMEKKEVEIETSTKSPEHAEQVTLPDSSPEEGDRPSFGELDIDKSELGRKSPAEREEDVKKIVASVAEVLKSEAPLEEFQGKLPFTQELRETHITTQDSPILDSKVITDDIPPIPEEPAVLKEEFEDVKDKRKDLIAGAQELMAASSKVISDIKSKTEEKVDKTVEKDDKVVEKDIKAEEKVKKAEEKDDQGKCIKSEEKNGEPKENDVIEEEEIAKAAERDDKVKQKYFKAEKMDTATKEKEEEDAVIAKEDKLEEKIEKVEDKLEETEIKDDKVDEKDDDSGTVHRMLVTASSEDGGEEIEICPPGTITFSKSSESSGRSSPEASQKTHSQKSSIVETLSDTLSTIKQITEKDLDIEKKELENEQEENKALSYKQTVEQHGVLDALNDTFDSAKELVKEEIEDLTKDTADEKAEPKLNEAGGLISGAVKSSEALADNLKYEVKGTEKKTEEDINEVKQDITDKIKEINTEAKAVTTDAKVLESIINDNVSKIIEGADDKASEVSETICDKVQEVSEISKNVSKNIEEDVKKGVQEVTEDTDEHKIAIRGKSMMGEMKKTTQKIEEFSDQSVRKVEVLEEVSDAQKIVTSQDDDAVSKSIGISKILQDQVTQIKDDTVDKIKVEDKSKELLSMATDIKDNQLEKTIDLVEENEISASIVDAKKNIESKIEDASKVAEKVKDFKEAVSAIEKIEDSVAQTKDQAEHKVKDVTEAAVAISEELATALEVEEYTDKTESQISDKLSGVIDKITEHDSKDIKEVLDNADKIVLDIKDALDTKAEDGHSELHMIGNEIKEGVKKIEEMAEQKFQEVKDIGTVVTESSKTADGIKDEVKYTDQQLEEKVQDVTDQVLSKAEDLIAKTDEIREVTKETVEAKVREAEGKVSDIKSTTDKHMQQVPDKTEEKICSVTEEIKKDVKTGEELIDEIKIDVGDKITDISVYVSKDADQIQGKINLKVEHIEDKAKESVGKVVDISEKILDRSGDKHVRGESEQKTDVKASEAPIDPITETADETAAVEGKTESVMDCMVEKAEQILKKPEETAGPVFCEIGDAAKSVLHEILPNHKVSDYEIKMDKDEELVSTVKPTVPGKSTPDDLSKDDHLEALPAICGKSTPNLPKDDISSSVVDATGKIQDLAKNQVAHIDERSEELVNKDLERKEKIVVDKAKDGPVEQESAILKNVYDLTSTKHEVDSVDVAKESLKCAEQKVKERESATVEEVQHLTATAHDAKDTIDIAQENAQEIIKKKGESVESPTTDSKITKEEETEEETKEYTLRKKESIAETAEDLLDKTEKAIESVSRIIGDSAKSVFDEILQDHESSSAEIKTSITESKDIFKNDKESEKLNSKVLSGTSIADVLGKDDQLEGSPTVSAKSIPDIPKDTIDKEIEKVEGDGDKSGIAPDVLKVATPSVSEKSSVERTYDTKEDTSKIEEDKIADESLSNQAHRRSSVIEVSEEFIEKFEKSIESVISPIGEAANSILQDKDHVEKEKGQVTKEKELETRQTDGDKLNLKKEDLQKEEKEIEDKTIHATEKADTVADLTKMIPFEKPKTSDEDKIENKIIEEKLGDEVEHIPQNVEELSGSNKKPSTLNNIKVDETGIKEDEKQIEAQAEGIKKNYEHLSKLTESVSFDKCKLSEDFKIDKDVIEKEEKQIDEKVAQIDKTVKDLSKLAESVSFDKCKPSDEFKIEKEVIEKEGKHIEEKVSHLQRSLEEVSDLSQTISFEKCHIPKEDDKVTQKQVDVLQNSRSDMTKSVVSEKEEKTSETIKTEQSTSSSEKVIDSNKLEGIHHDKDYKCEKQQSLHDQQEKKDPEKEHAKVVEKGGSKMEEIKQVKSDIRESTKTEHTSPKKEEKKVEKEFEYLEESSEYKFKHAEKKDLSPESHNLEDKISEISKSKESEDIHKKEDPSSIAKASVVLEDNISSQTEKCEKESMEKTSSEKDSCSLNVEHTEHKKLSISDVEICIKTEKCPIDVSQSFLDNEKALLRDNTDAKVYVHPVSSQEDENAFISQAGSSSILQISAEAPALSDKSSPDMELSGKTTPPTVPVSPIAKEIKSPSSKVDSGLSEQTETDDEDLSTKSQVAHSQSDLDELDMKMDPMSMSFYGALPEEQLGGAEDVPATLLYEITKAKYTTELKETDKDSKSTKEVDLMTASFIGELPSAPSDSKSGDIEEEASKKDAVDSWGKPLGLPAPTYLYDVTKAKYSSSNEELDLMSCSFIGERLPTSSGTQENPKSSTADPMITSVYFEHSSEGGFDPIASWGKPLGLPSPAPPNNNEKGTPKKERKLPAYVTAKNKLNDDKKRAESPSKLRLKKINPVYVDLTYVPHHGNHYYSYVDFFKKIRARYYVFSGLEPSRQVYDALLEAKQTWEDKELEVTIIPTYDTDILGYWVAENEELLSKFKIDLSPSASRCTINLQDHETSCSAYRLEF